MAVAELKVTQRLNEYEFGVTLRVMRSGVNRNMWDYQNLEQHYMSILGQPILCAFPNGRIGDGHLMQERTDANGEPYYSFISKPGLEQIVGTISDDPKDIRLVEEDGETWLIAEGRLFAFYAHELVEYIVECGVMDVSVETEVLEGHIDENNPQIEIFTDYNILGVTILGSGVAPAIPGANIKALQALESEFKAACLKAASLINTAEDGVSGTDDDIDDTEEEEGEGEGVIDVDDPDMPEDSDEEEEGLKNNESSDGEPEKPQNKTNSKGEIEIMQVFSKKQVAELAPKFDGYTVLAAGQDEAGIRVCLMSADGTTAVYTMENLDAMIDPSKIQKINASVSFAFDAETQLAVDSYELTDSLGADIIKATSELESKSAELKSAQETIESMQAAELKRRVSAAKAMAKATLEQFNANREEKVDVAVLESINEAIDGGEYSECLNADGEWCGEESVCEAVLAKCAKAVMAYDKAQVARNSTHYVWSEGAQHSTVQDEGVSALIAQWKAKKI